MTNILLFTILKLIKSLCVYYFPAAQAQLFGKPAVYVKEGSTISLTCAINLFSVPPPDITWMHGSKVSHLTYYNIKTNFTGELGP